MIKLSRGYDLTDARRDYKVFIDDVYRGDLKANETKAFNVGEGNHSVYVKIDWCRSAKLNVEVEDSALEINVGPNFSTVKIVTIFIVLLILEFTFDIYSRVGPELAAERIAIPLAGVILAGVIHMTVLRNKYLWIRKKNNNT